MHKQSGSEDGMWFPTFENASVVIAEWARICRFRLNDWLLCCDLLLQILHLKVKSVILRFKNANLLRQNKALRDKLAVLSFENNKLIAGQGEPLFQDHGGPMLVDGFFEQCEGIQTHGVLPLPNS